MSNRATISSMSSYAILGCGSVGHSVAEELLERGKQVHILDKDESRVEALRDQDLNAQLSDIKEPEVTEIIEDIDVILILASDVEANKKAVENIRERNDEQFLVARASDPVTSDELAELGADVVINPSAVIADAALRSLEAGELEFKAGQLKDEIENTEGKIAIITHDNPDPDSIASGTALKAIASHLGIEADILYLGDIGHQENRAFVNLLDIDLVHYDDVDMEDYGSVALVDRAKSGETTFNEPVDIFIDHFDVEDEVDASFVDIRPNVSATSTILTKYIQEFDMTISEEVATALLYGIRAETLDFRRDTTPADLTAAAYLYPFANHDTLEQVESPNMSPETLDVLAEAISNREVEGSHLVSNAGFINSRDALAQAAQQLLNLEGISTTAVFGIIEDTIYLAARSKDIRLNIGQVLQESFGSMGEAAGHSTQASAEIPLGIFTGIESNSEKRSTLLSLTEEAVKRKLFEGMGVDQENSGNGG